MMSALTALTGALLLLSALAAADTHESTSNTTSPPKRRLLFAAELCRHGDRSPLAEFPSDALPASKWPEGVGELTAIGIRAHYELGQRLRARYVDTGFLPSSWTPAEVYIRSTDVDRTLMSATSQFAGLYPPGTAANTDVRVRFGKDPLHEGEGGLPHLYQPVPVHTESRDTDVLLLPGKNCPRHAVLMREKYHSPEFQDVLARNADFLEVARKISGWKGPEFTIFNLERLSDTWTCFAAHSVPLPKAATPDIVGKARNLSNWLVTIGNQGPEVNRLRAGLILYELKKYMTVAALRDAAALPEQYASFAKKFVLFSAHDTTVAATLSAMRVFNDVNPPYNSTVIWELYRSDNGKLSVRVEFNGEALILPGCSSEYCPAKEYVASTAARTVPGPGARVFECLTGWRRYTTMVYHSFSGKSRDGLADLGATSDDDQSPSSGWGLLPSLFMLAAAAIGVVGAVRLHSRYKGYNPAATEPFPADDYGLLAEHNAASERRILM